MDTDYARVHDNASRVSAPTMERAQRIEKGSNQNWTITVEPAGNGAVSVTLPETTDCDADGAICTFDKRKLSHSTSVSIAGSS